MLPSFNMLIMRLKREKGKIRAALIVKNVLSHRLLSSSFSIVAVDIAAVYERRILVDPNLTLFDPSLLKEKFFF